MNGAPPPPPPGSIAAGTEHAQGERLTPKNDHFEAQPNNSSTPAVSERHVDVDGVATEDDCVEGGDEGLVGDLLPPYTPLLKLRLDEEGLAAREESMKRYRVYR